MLGIRLVCCLSSQNLHSVEQLNLFSIKAFTLSLALKQRLGEDLITRGYTRHINWFKNTESYLISHLLLEGKKSLSQRGKSLD